MQRIPETSILPPFTGTVVVSDEGIPLGSVADLDFVGAGVGTSISGSRARIEINVGAGGGAQFGFYGLNDGVPLQTGSQLDAGYGLELTLSGSRFRLEVETPVTGSIVVSDEGAVLGSVSQLNVIGERIGIEVSGSYATITVSPDPQEIIGIYGLDDGVPVGTGSWLDAGDGLTLTRSGTVLRADVSFPPDPAELIGIYGLDDGVPLGTGTDIDFGDNLTVSLSGTRIRVDVSAGATGSLVIYDEGTFLGLFEEVRFIGAGVSVFNSGSYAAIEIAGGGGAAQIGVMGWDDGVPLGTGSVLEAGDRISMTLSGTVLRLDVDAFPNPVDQIGVYGLDDGVPLGTGSWLEAGDRIAMTRSGTVLRLDVDAFPDPAELIGIYGLDDGVPVGTGSWFDAGDGLALTRSGTVLRADVIFPPDPAELIGFYGLQEGVPLGTGTSLDAGDGLELSLSGTRFRLVADALPHSGSIVVYDEASLLGSFPELRFSGDRLTVVSSGSYATVIVSPDPTEQIGVMGWDDGVPLGTGVVLDFGEGLQGTISGSVLRVDSRFSAGDVFFLRASGSGIGSYDLMLREHGGVSGSALSQSIGSTGTLLGGFITRQNVPLIDFINDGIFHAHIHALKTAGTKDASLLWQLFRYTTGTFEIPVLQSDTSPVLTASEEEYDIVAASDSIDLDPSDRLLLKILGKQVGLGTDPTVEIRFDGPTFARFEIPSPPNATTLVAVPLTGTVVLYDEGSLLGSFKEVRFIGAGVALYNSGTYAAVSIPGGGGGAATIGIYGLDDGVPLGTGSWLEAGDRISMSLSGTVLRLDVDAFPPFPQEVIGIYGLDDGVPVGTGSWLDAGDGLTLTRSGTVLRADVTFPPDPQEVIGIYGLDDGVPVGTGSWLDAGDGLSLTRSGTVLRADVSFPPFPQEVIGIYGLDDGVPLGTGSWLEAGDNLTMTRSGTVLRIDGTAAPVSLPTTGTFVAYDEDILLGSFPEVRFIGDGVAAYNSGSYIAISIPGDGGADQIGVYGLDEGVPLGTGTEIDFGDNLTATLSGTRLRVDATSGAAATGSMVIYDESVFVGLFEEMRFIGAGVQVLNSGSYAAIVISGSVGGDGAAGDATYMLAGIPTALDGPSGTYWQVPGGEYATGSLAVAVNGLVQTPGDAFSEQFASSGTYQLSEMPPTGAAHAVIFGVPAGSPDYLTESGTFFLGELLDTQSPDGSGFIELTVPTGIAWDYLEVNIRARAKRAGQTTDVINITFNGNTGTVYDCAYGGFVADNSIATSGVDGPNVRQIRGPSIPAAASPAGFFGVSTFRIYEPSIYGVQGVIGGGQLTEDTSTTAQQRTDSFAGDYNNGEPITTINLRTFFDHRFETGTVAELVGFRERVVVIGGTGPQGPPGPPGAGVDLPATGTVVIYDETTLRGSFPELRFIGAGVDAYHSGSYAAVSVPGGVDVRDDGGLVLPDADSLDFAYGVRVSSSGTQAEIGVLPRVSGTIRVRTALGYGQPGAGREVGALRFVGAVGQSGSYAGNVEEMVVVISGGYLPDRDETYYVQTVNSGGGLDVFVPGATVVGSQPMTSGTVSHSTMRLFPFVPRRHLRVRGMGFRLVTTVGGSQARLVIVDDFGEQTAKLGDSGLIAEAIFNTATGTGVQFVAMTGTFAPVWLKAGTQYWIGHETGPSGTTGPSMALWPVGMLMTTLWADPGAEDFDPPVEGGVRPPVFNGARAVGTYRNRSFGTVSGTSVVGTSALWDPPFPAIFLKVALA